MVAAIVIDEKLVEGKIIGTKMDKSGSWNIYYWLGSTGRIGKYMYPYSGSINMDIPVYHEWW